MASEVNRRALLLAGLALLAVQPALAQSEQSPTLNDAWQPPVRFDLAAVRDFYRAHFDFDVAFEASWFLYLIGPGEDGTRGATLAYMHPDHPSNPPGPETFNGLGMILTVEVSDAASVFERVSAGGAPIVHALTDEVWGQRRFMTRDPAGVLVDVVEQIAPKEGFWDQYMVGISQ